MSFRRGLASFAFAAFSLAASVAYATTVQVTVDPWEDYGGGCLICGTGYSACSDGGLASGSFADPTPIGAVITNVTVTIWGTACGAGSEIEVDLEGTVIASQVDDMSVTCACGDCFSSTPYVSADYPDGFPGYVAGGDNTVNFTMIDFCSTLYPGHFTVDVTYADTTCGDGVVEGGEQCEDLNAVDGDACTNRCRNATCGDGSLWTIGGGAEVCDDGNAVDTDGCVDCVNATCGDGAVHADVEDCDDANDVDTDACVDCATAACGDGHIQAGVEDCDDGNLLDTDACVACVAATCGDRVIYEGVEECDDGNEIMEDGCVGDCMAARCGDGFTRSRGGVEACDDGNDVAGDGCDGTCMLEHGFDCNDTVCTSECGDELVASDEGCDDGNGTAGDGCSPDCAVEEGWACEGEPSVCDDTGGSDADADTDADADADVDADIDADIDADGDVDTTPTSGGCCAGGTARAETRRGAMLASVGVFALFFRKKKSP